MKVDLEKNNDQLIVRPYGKIDNDTHAEFEKAMKEACAQSKNIVIDMSESNYVSSSGLRVFLAVTKNNPEHTIVFRNVSDVVMEVFEMTGFTDILTIEKDEAGDKPDIKAIFFDIDGTLLSHTTGSVPESTIRALKKVRENGISTVIATGRDINELKKLPLDGLEFDGYLTLNGNICLDHDLKMFAGNEIDPGEVEILVNIFKAGKLPFVLIGEEKRYINYVDDVVIRTQLSTHGTIPDIGEYQGEKIYQCIAFVDQETRKKLDALLDKCIITSWNDTGIDIIAKTGGKDAGIQKFLDKKKFSRKQTMAFGDGENDAPMINYVEIGVAMGNGKPALKEIADYVTDDIDNEGIEKALIHFGLI